MATVYFIGDLHLDHKKILEFSPNRAGDTVEEHNYILEEKYRQTVSKRDKVFFMGDVAFSTKSLQWLGKWPGQKILIRGNHDKLSEGLYRKVFSEIHGVIKYKKIWLSHCPIHPVELRGCPNVHGHVHNESIKNHYHELDRRYVNVCVETTNGYPISIDEIKRRIKDTKRLV